MRRRSCFSLFLLPAALLAQGGKAAVRGELIRASDGKPAIRTKDGRAVFVNGDGPTEGVLRDKRLLGADMELLGRLQAPDHFVADPIHTRSIFVYKDGKRLMVTYWCDLCSIRTYSPGKCWCCQSETHLDLREPDEQP